MLDNNHVKRDECSKRRDDSIDRRERINQRNDLPLSKIITNDSTTMGIMSHVHYSR